MSRRFVVSKRVAAIGLLAATAAGCSMVGRLTVRDYTSRSGAHVLAGQAEPKAQYQCEKLAQESRPWGLAGNMHRVSATEKLTAAAVDDAPAKGANYVYVRVPGEASVGGFNVNAFKDAQVAYYRCANLPRAAD